jgi:hypothetical protein
MKRAGRILMSTVTTLVLVAGGASASEAGSTPQCSPTAGCPKKQYVDVHQLAPGEVTFEAVAEAHAKDLEVQGRHDVEFEKFWVDEQAGLVYCLSSAPDSESVVETHREAHGLLPTWIREVTEGQAAALRGDGRLFLDVHHLGAGNVTAEAVAAAHEKDLAVQDAHDVNFVQYWVDEAEGVVLCLSEAPDPEAIRSTHREAHGLVPDRILEVTQGE